jgi:hypothetical protein
MAPSAEVYISLRITEPARDMLASQIFSRNYPCSLYYMILALVCRATLPW